jgi:hypothetical protein
MATSAPEQAMAHPPLALEPSEQRLRGAQQTEQDLVLGVHKRQLRARQQTPVTAQRTEQCRFDAALYGCCAPVRGVPEEVVEHQVWAMPPGVR